MDTIKIPGTKKYEGLITVTQESKYSDIWIAKDGREFLRNDYGTFTWINQTFEKSPSPPSKVMTRNHSDFSNKVDAEKKRALSTRDFKKLVND